MKAATRREVRAWGHLNSSTRRELKAWGRSALLLVVICGTLAALVAAGLSTI